jgi:WhiB family transcriptional regulator, redox-sensing transcriptional regulator
MTAVFRVDVFMASLMDELYGAIDAQPWQASALCAQTDPEAFYPEKGDQAKTAKMICAQCPVKSECLEYSLARDERFGIWGGLSERDRREIRKRREQAG